MPYQRLWDEESLNDNWTYFKNFPKLPLLILHGTKDSEVGSHQAYIWKEKLPFNDITLILKEDANHAFGIGSNGDMQDIACKVNTWLNKKILSKKLTK